jgi:hypothetical protein
MFMVIIANNRKIIRNQERHGQPNKTVLWPFGLIRFRKDFFNVLNAGLPIKAYSRGVREASFDLRLECIQTNFGWVDGVEIF